MREALIAAQNDDGGVGWRAEGPSATEPTALAMLAFASAGLAGVADAARGWLRAQRLAGSGWPPMAGVHEPSWATAPAVLALARSPEDRALAEEGGRWLIERRGQRPAGGGGLIARLLARRRVVDLDASIVGWPWSAGTFSWVEPTAWAVLALKALDSPAPEARERIRAGERLLADRRCVDGGWNYGNKRVLGEELWAYPDTTALALLALAPAEASGDLGPSLVALEGMLERNRSGLATALGILALDAYGREVGALRARLHEQFARTGFAGDARALALALLALAEGERPLTETPRA